MAMTLLTRPRAPLWVIGGPRHPAALAIAGRLALPFLRVVDGGPDADAEPEIVLSAGPRALMRALLLRAHHGCRVVHCTSAPSLPDPTRRLRRAIASGNRLRAGDGLLPRRSFAGPDLVIRSAPVRRIERSAREFTALGPLGIVSPDLLASARLRWAERLDHLPLPRIVLLVRCGGLRPLAPGRLHVIASALAGRARASGGVVLASIDRASGPAAHDAVRYGLRDALNLVHRTDEPGEDPTLGFLASADAVVLAGAHAATLSEVAAVTVPTFVDPLDDFARGGRLLLASLLAEQRVRLFDGSLERWSERTPLDETGRAAAAIRSRLRL